MLISAEAPMIHAGSGIIHADAFAALRRVAELLHAPVTTSWAGRGVLPETSPLAVPMPHVELNHKVRNDSDAVLIIGRASARPTVGHAAYWRNRLAETIRSHRQQVIGLNKRRRFAILADARRTLNCWRRAERRQGEIGSTAAAPCRRLRQTMQDDRNRVGKALADMATR